MKVLVTFTLPEAAVVAPIEISAFAPVAAFSAVPLVVVPVALTVMSLPPLITNWLVPDGFKSTSVDKISVVAAAVRVEDAAVDLLVAFSVVRPEKPVAVLTVTAAPLVKLTVSMLLTVAPTGMEIAAACVTLNVSLPAPPSILSATVQVAAVVSAALKVSSRAVPTKAAPVSAPVVSVLEKSF